MARSLGMTPRELAGWVAAEKHIHYDADGNPTGYTIVERESRIDDIDRADLLGLARYEAEVHRCGYHPSVANDPANTFQPVDLTCRVCAGEAAWERMQRERDEAAEKQLKDAPPIAPRPWDGRQSYMQLLTPAEAAAIREQQKGGEHGDQA